MKLFQIFILKFGKVSLPLQIVINHILNIQEMSLKERGIVIAIGQKSNGLRKSDGQPWTRQEYVIETGGKYPKKVAFSLMNEKIEKANIQLGQTIEIDADAQSREYNGKWYTEIIAWKVENYGVVQPVANQQPGYQQTAPQGYAPSVKPVNQFGQPVNQYGQAVQTAPAADNNDIPF